MICQIFVHSTKKSSGWDSTEKSYSHCHIHIELSFSKLSLISKVLWRQLKTWGWKSKLRQLKLDVRMTTRLLCSYIIIVFLFYCVLNHFHHTYLYWCEWCFQSQAANGTNNCWFPLARKWPTWKWTWIWIPYGKIEKICPRYFRRDSRKSTRSEHVSHRPLRRFVSRP